MRPAHSFSKTYHWRADLSRTPRSVARPAHSYQDLPLGTDLSRTPRSRRSRRSRLFRSTIHDPQSTIHNPQSTIRNHQSSIGNSSDAPCSPICLRPSPLRFDSRHFSTRLRIFSFPTLSPLLAFRQSPVSQIIMKHAPTSCLALPHGRHDRASRMTVRRNERSNLHRPSKHTGGHLSVLKARTYFSGSKKSLAIEV